MTAKKARVLEVIILIVILSGGIFVFQKVSADAWWGKGHKTPEWVISHGGTLIYYTVENAKGDTVIKLFTKSGHAIEREHGTRGVFDDGLANTEYYLRVQSGNKKFKSKIFKMQRGSKNYATANVKKEKIKVSLGKRQFDRHYKRRIINVESIQDNNSFPKNEAASDLPDYIFQEDFPEPAKKPYQMNLINSHLNIKIAQMTRFKLPVYWEDDFLTIYWFPRKYDNNGSKLE